MKASETKFLKLLEGSEQFTIPIYQRTYSWQERECETLWNDILRCGSNDHIESHFLGSIVYVESEQQQVSVRNSNLVIDGQQRLTSLMLLLEALARVLKGEELIEGLNAPKIRTKFLTNPFEKGMERFKLRLTQTDEATLNAIILNDDMPSEASNNIIANFNKFKTLIERLNGDYEDLCRGLHKLMVVDIALDRKVDNPQLIFESMNSTGKELSQADLIRNFVLMGHDKDTQDTLYDEVWRPMELEFGQSRYDSDFDIFVRHYLTIKNRKIARKREVYQEFKRYFQQESAKKSTREILLDLRRFSQYYCSIIGCKDKSPLVSAASSSLVGWGRVDVAFPLLLELFDDRNSGLLADDELEQGIRLVESYIFRRYVCEIPTNSMNSTFANLALKVDKENYLESLKSQFLLLQSYKRLPDNEEFTEKLISRDMYSGSRALKYFLRRLENANRKEEVVVEDYTIEHIMPQNQNLSAIWKQDLGESWKEIHDQKLHTIGNLTLTGYNSEYSDKPFKEKQTMVGGFKDSPLRVNAGLAEINRWDESAINKRAKDLADKAKELWAYPNLPEEFLEKYRNEETTNKYDYSIDDHEYLQQGEHARELFDELRHRILNLDKNVTEEWHKKSIAFIAEERILDVVPLKESLKIYLNCTIDEVVDTRNIIADVSEIGRWSVGECLFVVQSLSEMNYALGLVEQVLENQIS